VSDLLPVDDAIGRIVAGVEPLGVETVALDDAAGRVLAAPLTARRTQPPFDASAMDGYAVRAADVATVPVTLTVIGMSAAGRGFAGAVGPGQAVRIFTGAPLPAGADAILIQENAVADGDTVVAQEPLTAGRHVRPAGYDFRSGAVLFDAGRRLAMRQLGLAASMGFGALAVRRRPRVAILSTGDELVPPGADPGPDQIVASNAVAVAAYVGSLGGEATDLGIVRDDVGAIAAAVDAAVALPADVLVTIGGASVGDHDLVHRALVDRGMTLGFWRIAMRPGKPLMFGRIPRTAGGMPPEMRVLGLPGNPASSAVCAIVFLGPLIDALLGLPASDRSEPAMLGADVAENGVRQDYQRATLAMGDDGRRVATPLSSQDSGMLSSLAAADCLIVRPPHAPAARAGDPCRILRLP